MQRRHRALRPAWGGHDTQNAGETPEPYERGHGGGEYSGDDYYVQRRDAWWRWRVALGALIGFIAPTTG